MMPTELEKIAAKNPQYTPNPYALDVSQFDPGDRHPTTKLEDPLAGDLRMLTAFTDARLVLIPVEVRFIPVPKPPPVDHDGKPVPPPPVTEEIAVLRVAVVDTRFVIVAWTGDIPSIASKTLTPAVTQSLATRLGEAFSRQSMGVPVTLIPGDGIGPSITDATGRLLAAAGADIDWDVQLAGLAALKAVDDPLPQATVESIRRTHVALKGPLETPAGEGYRSINVALRSTFDLYANVRPAHVIVRSGRFDKVDIVLVRENTEGLYIGIEHYIRIGDDPRAAAESTALIARAGSERVIRYAFDYAVRHGRRKVTLVHKANILKFSQGLFLEVGRQVAREFEPRGIAFEDRIVDAMAMNLVLAPERFDVIVTTNLFGDILSDEISGLVGGLGLAPGANIGTDAAIFEAVHGTAPDLAGKGVANPGAIMLASCLMLEHMGETARASRIRAAIEDTIRSGRSVTRDLGGQATTDEFTDAIIDRLR